MDINKKKHDEDEHDRKLKSYSEVSSLSRLSDRDVEAVSSITAGGDELDIDEVLDEQLDIKNEPNMNIEVIEQGGGNTGKGKGRRDT